MEATSLRTGLRRRGLGQGPVAGRPRGIGNPTRSAVLLAALVWLAADPTAWLALSRAAAAQFDGGDGGRVEVADPSLFESDRTLVQRLDQARQMLADGRYSEGVRFLASILEAPQDYFYQPDKSAPVFRSLKTEAQRLLGSMPRAGRDSYELQFGAQARQLLVEAAARRDAAALADVARRYFHTEAGYRAAYLAGCDHFDQGRPLLAALSLAPLTGIDSVRKRLDPGLSLMLATSWLLAGDPPQAERVLDDWLSRQRQPAQIAGQKIPAFRSAPEGLAWLAQEAGAAAAASTTAASEDWLVHRGDVARNGPSSAAVPLLVAQWRVRTSSDPQVEETLTRLGEDYRDRGLSALPGLQPIVVGNRIVMRSALSLSAVDLTSGKRLWESAAAEAAQRLLITRGSWSLGRVASQLEWGLEQRMWDDATYGTLSSDGQRVFSVEDLSLGPGLSAMPAVVLANLRRRSGMNVARGENRLAAHSIATGKLVWELGGPLGEAALEEAGTFFLGAPLPLGGELYALAEKAGEIRLLVIDAAAGHVRWSQQLAVVEDSVLQHPRRRMAGTSPTYADGVLVCPTVAGAVVAVDLTRRTLLWGYQYPRPTDPDQQELLGQGVAVGRLMAAGPDGPGERWIDATALVADGRVLITPVETNELHCLDLSTGEVRWKTPRGDGLYIAGVRDGRVLVVGRGHAWGISLDSGETIWSPTRLDLPLGAQPSGRGVWSAEGDYYLPLTSAEIVCLDVAQGRITSRVRSRTGEVPGNLIVHRGTLLSQGVEALSSYPLLEALQSQVAEQLHNNPDDARALALRGQVLLEQGQLAPAAEALRRSLALDDRRSVRQALVTVLLEGLRRDFAAFQASHEEIERMAQRPEDRAAYLRLMASGWQSQGQFLEAFRVYLRLADPELGPPTMEQVDADCQVRRDRWVRAEIEQLFQQAGPDQRPAMERELSGRLEAAMAQNGPEGLRRYVQFFAGGSLTDQARAELVRRLDPERDSLELEFALRHLARSADAPRAAEATLRLAQLYATRARPREAALAYHRLADEFGDMPLADGSTGRQLVERLAPDSPVRAALEPSDPWPVGKVELSKAAGAQPTYQRASLAVRGPVDPALDDLIFEWDQARQGQPLVAVDGQGRELWQVPLIDINQRVGYEFTPLYNHVQLRGHLVLLSIGRRVLAINGLGEAARGSDRILWSRDTAEALPGTPGTQMMQTQALQLEWGAIRSTISDGYGRALALMGPLSEDYLILPGHRSLTAVDPRTGETLWVREHLPAGCECFGDEELIFAVPVDGNEAVVLRAWDGRELGTRKLPSVAERLASQGRRVVSWTPQPDGSRRIEMVDAWSGQSLWQRSVAAGSKADWVDDQRLAVAQPDGTFCILRLADGTDEITAQLEPTPEMTETFVLSSPRQFVAIINRPQTEGTVWLRAIPGGADNHLVHGQMAGFDRQTGKLIWTRPVERQALVARQPNQLPVLVLACHIYERPVSGGRQNRNHVAILCLDKRTGRPAYQDRLQAGLAGYALTPDPAQHILALRLLRETVLLKFTGEPLPAESPAETQADSASGSEANGPADDENADEAPAPTAEAEEPAAPAEEPQP